MNRALGSGHLAPGKVVRLLGVRLWPAGVLLIVFTKHRLRATLRLKF